MVKNPNMARHGAKNGRWKGGCSKTYYRQKFGCKPNDGKIVHHNDGNRTNNKPSNVKILDNRGKPARAKHNGEHPEKGGYHKQKRIKRLKRKLMKGMMKNVIA